MFEEVTRSFRPRLVLVTLIGCAVAAGCSRIILGDRPDFVVETPDVPPVTQLWIFVAFGLAIGVAGAAYNRLVMIALTVADRMSGLSPVVRAGVVGAAVGALLLIDPLTVGGGDALSQRLLGGEQVAVSIVLGYLAVRLVTGPLSYSAGVPGGLFAPLLAVGVLCGAVVTPLVVGLVPGFGERGAPLLVVGMAACFAAMLAATLVRSEPIYDSLKSRAVRSASPSS